MRGAKRRADLVSVSMHWGLGDTSIHAYERDVAHAAVDAGADMVLGSGPHRSRAVEIHRGRPIFYSLGNFSLDKPRWVDPSGRPPWHAAHHPASWTYDPADGSWSYTFDAECSLSMIAKIEIAGREIASVRFLPVLIDDRAQPRVLRADDPGFADVLRHVEKVTRNEGIETRFTVEGDEVVVRIPV